MIHPSAEIRRIDSKIGYGVFATQFIPKGTVTWTFCALDREFSIENILSMPEQYQRIFFKYGYVNPLGAYILLHDFERYVNHSCQPNTCYVTQDIEIATKDIYPDEEITCDYGVINYSTTIMCRCNTPGCRKKITPEDAFLINDEYAVMQSTSILPNSKQPLYDFIQDKSTYTRAVENKFRMPAKDMYFKPNLTQQALLS